VGRYFAARHDPSPNALSSFSCFFNKQFPWLFDFTLGLFFAFGCIGLGFGFRPFHCLSFNSSLVLFFFHPSFLLCGERCN
jgi:hypothetical protein